MLNQRSLLAAIIVLATVLFVVGVSIERSEGHHDEGASATHVESGEGEASEASEGAAHEEGEASETAEGTGHEEEEDEKVLGVDLESTPFMLAALVSLELALGAWLRPDSAALLGLLALAMLAFAVFDIAEIGHQIEESEAGLVVIAALVAGLHLAASAVAFTMRRQLGQSPG